MSSPASTNEIEHRFKHHPPKDEQRVREHEAVRASIRTLAHFLDGTLPGGRESALVQTKLEEAMFWANAAIARQREA